MFRFITSKPLVVNITVGILMLALFLYSFFASMAFITGHGKYEVVPSVEGLDLSVAKSELNSKGFNVKIDSIYSTTVPPLAVIKQFPVRDAIVKKGRLIFLIINKITPPLVDMPNLLGLSYKGGVLYLNKLGLSVGDTTYKPYFLKDYIMGQEIQGKSISLNSKIAKGSKIDLILGSGIGNEDIDVPNLLGLSLRKAKEKLETLGFLLGDVITIGSVGDSLSAYVVKQIPEVYSPSSTITKEKIPNKTRKRSSFDFYICSKPPVMDTSGNLVPPTLLK